MTSICSKLLVTASYILRNLSPAFARVFFPDEHHCNIHSSAMIWFCGVYCDKLLRALLRVKCCQGQWAKNEQWLSLRGFLSVLGWLFFCSWWTFLSRIKKSLFNVCAWWEINNTAKKYIEKPDMPAVVSYDLWSWLLFILDNAGVNWIKQM